ncbi:PEGA domain-containing protein [Methanoregula sp.]|uniref:PEGA domain-containing protein n=1 Tax=Methanoregula sp. TaxID=2052170 RepID=UPI003C26A7E8
MKWHNLVLPSLLIIALVMIVPPVSAKVWTINNGTAGIIQKTIDNARSGDTIDLGPGTYFEHDIKVSKDIIIEATPSTRGTAINTFIDAQGRGRIFNVTGKNSFTVNFLSLQNGRADNGSAIYFNGNGGTLNIVYTTISGCSATVEGGAIYSPGPAIINIEDSTRITGCSAEVGGGAIYSGGGTLTIDDSSFSDCSASEGGGAIAANGSTIIISSTTFTNCQSSNAGGAIATFNGSTISITSSTFTNCSATPDGTAVGGAIATFGGGKITIETSTFKSCSADGGGAISSQNGATLIIESSTFTDCSVTTGGGAILSNGSGTTTITSSTFTNCSATGSNGAIEGVGGAIAIEGTTTIKSSMFTNCSATSGSAAAGGAIAVLDQGTLTIDSSTFTGCSVTGNNSGGAAGGVLFTGGTTTIKSSTFTNCMATTAGGAIFTVNGELTLKSSTITGCSASQGGAIYAQGPVTIDHSSISNCTAPNGGCGIWSTYTASPTIISSTVSVCPPTRVWSSNVSIMHVCGVSLFGLCLSGGKAVPFAVPAHLVTGNISHIPEQAGFLDQVTGGLTGLWARLLPTPAGAGNNAEPLAVDKVSGIQSQITPDQTGSIAVTSDPGGAAIQLDGTDTGQVTPCTLNLVTPGDHILTASHAGFNPENITVTVTAGSTATAHFPFGQNHKMSIPVTSRPGGAETPLLISPTTIPSPVLTLNPGNHITHINDGINPVNTIAPVTAVVTPVITSGINAPVNANIQHLRITDIGSLAVTSTPANAEIWINGQYSGQVTPYTFTEDSGTYKVVVKMECYTTPDAQTVAVSPPESATADFNLASIKGCNPTIRRI